MQPETVPVYAFCFDPADEFASVGGFDWFWTKSHALGAFDDACASPCYGADNLSVLEVLVPVSVIQQGRDAVTRFIDEQTSPGPPEAWSPCCVSVRPESAPNPEPNPAPNPGADSPDWSPP